MSEDISTPGPTLGQLRAAGVEGRVARLRADIDAAFGMTRRGRIALRLARWYGKRLA